MIKRIVKLELNPTFVTDFEAIFKKIKIHIEGFDGCKGLELYADKQRKGCYFTLSLWESQDKLEKYRHSAFFEEVWADIKPHFTARPLAWSTELIA